ncbi:MAG: trimethylamine-N-oxide reductase TorA [Rhodoplanes sp.]|uniref:trimethylamine-N-oxide reductase TorA n=1 Tax=Rhodoplanes sp. TaxID=1968906 RepID=UPI001793EF9A|nr:trimethylamine-N-oxide reductase TorA [Rhodoplanes sp.]NVO15095.1 trimethylamine-N-oxide reductase TorA [Rhodoplanes sp.]
MTIHLETARRRGVSRRTFMEGTAAIGLGVAVGSAPFAGRAVAASAPGVLTATHWGVMRAVVENGRFVKALPFEKDPHPVLPMIEATPSLVYSPSRVQYPMVRKGFLEKGHKSDTAERGTGAFVRVSWDQALDLVARELKRVKAEFGPASFFVGDLGWKSSGRMQNPRAALAALMNLHGGYSAPLGDYSTGAAQAILPRVLGNMEVYAPQSAWPGMVQAAEMLVVWGADPMVTLNIGYSPPDHQGFQAFEAFKKKGTPTVVIDPKKTETASYLNAQWVAPRPGSDTAIALALAHTVYSEKLHDEKFLKDYTVGFDKFVPYLTGASDGQPKDAAWAAKIAGIEPDTIRDLARQMAKKRTFIVAGWSIQRTENGEQTYWALVTLAAMLGQIGLPGGGISFGYHYSSSCAPQATAGGLTALTAGKPPEKMPPRIPCARLADMLLNPGQELDFNGRKLTYPDIRMILWGGGNPLSHHQDRNKLIAAWRKPEVIVIQEPFWTTTARFADIVLPATTPFERNDIEWGGEYSRQYIVPMHKVIEPVGEARNDYEISAALAEKLGYGAEFGRKDDMELIRSYYTAAVVDAKKKGVDMPDFDTFWKSGDAVEFPVSDKAKSWVRHGAFRDDPAVEPLGTPSGKIEIFSTAIEKMGYEGLPGHAVWIAPKEWLGTTAATAKWPLHMISPHPKYRLHSQMDNSDIRKISTVQGREPIEIARADAERRGIKDGDVVRVFNARGQSLAGARVVDDLLPGVVRFCEGSWYDPMEPGKLGTLDKYGSANQLTQDVPSSKLGQACAAHTALVEIERFTGPLPAVTAFDAPKA